MIDMPVSSKRNSDLLKEGTKVRVKSLEWFSDNCTDVHYTKFGNDFIFYIGERQEDYIRISVDFLKTIGDMDLEIHNRILSANDTMLYTLKYCGSDSPTGNIFLTTFFTEDMLEPLQSQ